LNVKKLGILAQGFTMNEQPKRCEIIRGFVPFRLHNGKDISYKGFIEIKGQPYYMVINIPDEFTTASLQCEWKLQHQILHKADLIKQRLQTSNSVKSFLRELKLIAETCLDLGPKANPWSAWNEDIMEQVLEVTSCTLLKIEEDFSYVHFGVIDGGERMHKILIHLHKQDASAPPVCSTDLPHKLTFHWSTNTRLQHILQQFEASVASYQEFWATMQELDSKCWVLEPEKPSFADTHRRIALGQNLSVQITVNCHQPSALPECRFLGAESATTPLQEKLNVNLHRWEVDRSLLNNLEEVLDLDFPSRANTSVSAISMECGICYCLHLDTEVPTIVCEDQRCAQPFHHACLYEWLRNLSSRQSFHTIFGECPFCSHPIKIKMPDTS